jgi:hypothetical protein
VIADAPDAVKRERSTDAGRISRAVPLLLAEQVYINTLARTRTLVPWVTSGGQRFVLYGEPWSDEEAAAYAKTDSAEAEFVVVSHIDARFDPFKIYIRLLRVEGAQCAGAWDYAFSPKSPTDELAQYDFNLVGAVGMPDRFQPPWVESLYDVVRGPRFGDYLLRLEQLLAVRCAAREGAAGTLYGEREIIEGNMKLCADEPSNPLTRLLFAQTLVSMQEVRPQIVAMYGEQIVEFQEKSPLPGRAQETVKQMLWKAIGIS